MNAQPETLATTPADPPRLIDNGDGTVTVPSLGLMFTKDTLCEEEVDHDTAGKLCAECRIGGHDDWRRPGVQELVGLVDYSRADPAIDTAFFPDTRADWYWTDTVYAPDPSCAWLVYFYDGDVSACGRDGHDAFVRACRAVPAGQ